MLSKNLLKVILLASLPLWSAPAPDSVFTEVCTLIRGHFFRADFIQDSLPVLEKEYHPRFAKASAEMRPVLMRQFVARLGTSHTEYLTPDDPLYYQLAATFQLPGTTYPTIGVIAQNIGDQIFVVSVLPGGAADKAGVLAGDEILSVNDKPFRPVASFRGLQGKSIRLAIKRTAAEKPKTFTLTPEVLNPLDEALRAEKASFRIETIRGHKIGYVHIYLYGGQQFQEALEEALLWGPLHEADAVIIDLRFGLGGADPSYLRLFDKNIPVLTSVDQKGVKNTYDPQWRKPVAYLVDRSSRSGKEILAYAARKYGTALVLGDTTAGAVLAGSLFPISNGDRLYLAVTDAYVDGERIEGHGVAPNVWIPWDIRYQKGVDPRIEKSMEILADSLSTKK